MLRILIFDKFERVDKQTPLTANRSLRTQTPTPRFVKYACIYMRSLANRPSLSCAVQVITSLAVRGHPSVAAYRVVQSAYTWQVVLCQWFSRGGLAGDLAGVAAQLRYSVARQGLARYCTATTYCLTPMQQHRLCTLRMIFGWSVRNRLNP